GDRKMRKVRRADGDGINTVLAGALACDHGLEVVIGTCRIQAFTCSEGVTTGGINVECTCRQLPGPILTRGDTMYIADIGATSAPHHSKTQRLFRRRICSHGNPQSSPSMARLASLLAPDFTK